MPTFSIIMPTYNHGHCIARSLQSIIDQTFTDWETIVINNFSIDNTIEVVNSFSDLRIKLINFKNNGIIGASRNVGIRAAKAEWIAFLDSDDWWYRNKLEIVSKHLNDADIIYHDLHIFNKNGKIFRKHEARKLFKPVFNDLMTRGNALPTSSVVVKKGVLNSVNLFDDDKRLIGIEDFDMWLKISRKKAIFYYIGKTLGAYWIGTGNTTQDTEERYKRVEYCYKQYLPFLSPQDRYQSKAFMGYVLGAIRWRSGLHAEAIKLFKISAKCNKIEIKFKSYFIIIYRYMSEKFPNMKKWSSLFWAH